MERNSIGYQEALEANELLTYVVPSGLLSIGRSQIGNVILVALRS